MNARGGFPLKVCLILGLAVASPCLADILYTDLGPGNTFLVNREFSTNFDLMATPFVTTGGGNLGDVVTPLFSLDNPVSLGLYTDSAGRPGSLLENWNVTAPGFPGILTTIPSVQNPYLSADTQYWLVISLTDAQKDRLAWYQNNQVIEGGIWLGNSLDGLLDFTPASPVPAIELDSTSGSAVPEPSSAIWIGSVMLALVVGHATCRRRCR